MNKSRLLRLFYCGSAVGLSVSSMAVSGELFAVGCLLLAVVLMASELFGFYVDEMDEWRSRRPAIDSYCMRCRCHASHCWRTHEQES